MVLTDSHGISRAPCYLGSPSGRPGISATGLTPTLVRLSIRFVYTRHVTAAVRQNSAKGPTTPTMQPLPGITHDRFSLIRFRSPLLTESRLFSLPVGTEMFHFPTFPLPALYIQAGVTRSPQGARRGFPIRKSSDHSSFISSPRLIADYDVLLRLQMPRHPPFALRNLKSHEFDRIRAPRPESPDTKLTSEYAEQHPRKDATGELTYVTNPRKG